MYILECKGIISISTYNVYLNLTIYIFNSIIVHRDSQRVLPLGSSLNTIKHVEMAFRCQLPVGNEGLFVFCETNKTELLIK